MFNALNYKRIIKKLSTVIGMALLFFTAAGTTLLAAENDNRIRVGYFELPGFNEYDDLGNPSGYNVAYLNYMAEYTGWNYEYIKANSWPEALQLLEEGKIDIVAPSQRTKERLKRFDFPDYPIGTEYGSILTLDTNYELNFEDFESFSKIRIGCVSTLVFKEDFFEYARSHGFVPKVTYYKDTNALMSALKIGEVDAVVANLMNAKKNLKVLAKFAPGSYYYMINKDNDALLKELNETIYHMKVYHPEVEALLTDTYFPQYTSVAFTKEEQEYIDAATELTVGCISDRLPISYVNETTGKMEGITIDILDRISEISGLKFKYVPLPRGKITYDYLSEHGIQLVSSVEYNSANTSLQELSLTNPYLSTRKVMVGKKNTIEGMDPLRIALCEGSVTLEEMIKRKYPKSQILFYETIEECFEAVVSGKSDVLIQNQYVVERLLPKPKYEKLVVVPSEGIEDALSISAIVNQRGMEQEDPMLADKRLISILNKAIAYIDRRETADIIIQESARNPYKITVGDFFYQYRYFIIALTAAILAGSIIGIYAFLLRTRNAKILKLSEMKLKSITNNINGGVVVLLPNKGLKITFANEGFLSLIQYTAKEYEELRSSDYITYVHPDDIEALNNLITKPRGDYEHLSIQLRLLRKDGTYLPTLFNGTLSESYAKQRELYCVIMDMSEQLKIMDKLEREQARYQLLLDKSDDMIFDVNLETKEIAVTKNFKKKFGWTLPKYYDEAALEHILSLWHIHEEDLAVFRETISQILDKGMDTECRVRIWKSDLTYRWCDVSHNIMKKNDVGIRLIGKVTDIDDEIREKERLVRQTQIDSLSGLYNKEAFNTISSEYFKENKYHNAAIIFIDLDNFKQVNDGLGHIVGDKAIREAAKKLQIIFSQFDVLSRFGGDEFCILVKEIPLETLYNKLSWTVEKMRETYKNEKLSVNVTASIGAALSPQCGTELSQLLLCADQALYSAKENGKNQFVVYSEDLPVINHTEHLGE